MRTVAVAVVEDDESEYLSIKSCLERFSAESGGENRFECAHFCDAEALLHNYKPIYDIVLMDIGLPNLNGFEASKKLRNKDPSVLLIFVTNLSQFAVAGYEVSAFDFIVKPVKYGTLRLKLLRALQKLEATDDKKISVPSSDGMRVILVSSIKYVEVMNHDLVYHTTAGDVKSYGSLNKVQAVLPSNRFARCNSCYLVNLKFVTDIKDYSVFVAGEEIAISRAKKKDFLSAVAGYLEETT